MYITRNDVSSPCSDGNNYVKHTCLHSRSLCTEDIYMLYVVHITYKHMVLTQEIVAQNLKLEQYCNEIHIAVREVDYIQPI